MNGRMSSNNVLYPEFSKCTPSSLYRLGFIDEFFHRRQLGSWNWHKLISFDFRIALTALMSLPWSLLLRGKIPRTKISACGAIVWILLTHSIIEFAIDDGAFLLILLVPAERTTLLVFAGRQPFSIRQWICSTRSPPIP